MFKDLKSKQSFTIAAITFWSQFASYSFSAILILYLTKSTLDYGLGFSEDQAYSFQGVSKAMVYAIIMIGGFMADKYLGLRRSILIGSILLAFSFLVVFISGFFVQYGNKVFIYAYASIPACSSLLMGTSSAMVSKIYREDRVLAKGAMTLYYMSINLGSLLAFVVAPLLIDYKYGPLAVLGIVFIGKLLASLNFAWRYKIYDNVVDNIDKQSISQKSKLIVFSYLLFIYLFTIVCYQYPDQANVILGMVSVLCLVLFLFRSLFFLEGAAQIKQIIGLCLIVVAVVFFVIYNQMESTLIMTAQNNSDLKLLGLSVNPANYQLINPVIIIFGGMLLIRIYPMLPRFYIPYQFATGTALAALGLFMVYFGFLNAHNGIISGNYIALTYLFISISELFVSAIGLSMIGIYCDPKMMGFAMGAWYISASLSNSITGLVNQLVALPEKGVSILESAYIYKEYFYTAGLVTLVISMFVFVLAIVIIKFMKIKNIEFV
ncbi:peptide MFS transporter [Pseudofrancisella aestuarii]|uniref:Peptide MFS transporter n=1 Tax=Pseudofrancisella aestuarii TaxID=2670347 RepID=A0ABV9TB31_9GAMM|nr:oligopeptide:H+ symporter [Pseudofrancisella aestuarii]